MASEPSAWELVQEFLHKADVGDTVLVKDAQLLEKIIDRALLREREGTADELFSGGMSRI